MRDIIKLLFSDGDGDGQGPESWDQPGRRARVGDSREWCGTQPGEGTLGALAAALGGRRRRPARVVVKGKRW